MPKQSFSRERQALGVYQEEKYLGSLPPPPPPPPSFYPTLVTSEGAEQWFFQAFGDPFLEASGEKGNLLHWGSQGEQPHAQDRGGVGGGKRWELPTSNLGKEKLLFLPSLLQQHLFRLCPAPLATPVCRQPALSFQLSQNYMKKLYLYYIKTVSGGLGAVGLKVGLLCSSGQGRGIFFFRH